MRPIILGPNQPAARPYSGGPGIRALRGEGSTAPDAPEDWVASTTTTAGSATTGLTVLPDGRTLRAAVEADPEGWLGAPHVARSGAETSLLVKILDTGERLFNHFHPDAAFARTHLGSDRGKTEAWFIAGTGGAPTATVWLGFSRDVTSEEVADWFERQAVDTMLDALNPVTVTAGDWVYVPAGTPHAIGAGITLVELQEPSDLSIVLEYAPFPSLNREQALLGLPAEVALRALPTARLAPDRLAALHGHTTETVGRKPLFPEEARAFFRAERIGVAGAVSLEAGFSVLVVLDGAGTLRWDGGEVSLARGVTAVVPHGAGATSLSGRCTVLRCEPPEAPAPQS